MHQDIEDGMDLIRCAIEQNREDIMLRQWISLLPVMVRGKFVPFDEFKESINDRMIDKRPTSEILRELDEIEKSFQK